MAKPKHRVVIVGGGFGGIKAALRLCEDERFQVTLISSSTNFSIYGMLFHVATGGTHRVSSIPLQEIFEGKRIHLLHDKVATLDREGRTVTTEVGHTIPYDALILGLGVVTNYFGIKGLREYSYGVKSLEEAQELKQHLHHQLIVNKQQDLNYVVVGGGPTGIELAGMLPSYIAHIAKQHGLPKRKVHVDLVEAAPRLVPRMPKDVSRRIAKHLRSLGIKIFLNTAVQAQTADALMIHDKPIRSHTVIWTAGMTNNPFFSDNQFQLTKTGKVRVDMSLQAEPAVYVIGDNADTPYSGMAQTALRDGHYVAENLIRIANGQDTVPYKPKRPVYVFPAGPNWAAVVWGKLRMYGKVGYATRRAADLVAYNDYESLERAFARFAAASDTEESCVLCADEFERLNYRSGEV